VKVISLWQPWASLMADGKKRIETRHWPAPKWLIGERLAIHATMKVDKDSCYEFGYSPLTIPRGCVVSIHRLIKCEQFTEQSRERIGDDYGDFEAGRYGWFMDLLQKLDPIKAIGHQSIWDWTPPWDN
jgi:hypothetical protein